MYKASIKEASRELNAKERIMLKDTKNVIRLDRHIKDDEPASFTVVDWVLLDIHNDKSDNPDYHMFIFTDQNGTKYGTGSNSFINSFMEIYGELKESEDENIEWGLLIYKVPSKNYSGKCFLTCSVI